MHIDDAVIASPCTMRWEDFEGLDPKRRFCGQCGKHVHNLSAMTRDEVEALVAHGGSCVIYEYTTDGYLVMVTRKVAATAPARQLRGTAKLLAAAAMVAPMLTTSVACGGMPNRGHYRAIGEQETLRTQERRASERLARYGISTDEVEIVDERASER